MRSISPFKKQREGTIENRNKRKRGKDEFGTTMPASSWAFVSDFWRFDIFSFPSQCMPRALKPRHRKATTGHILLHSPLHERVYF